MVTSAGPRTTQAVTAQARSRLEMVQEGPLALAQPAHTSLHRVLIQEEKFGKRERERNYAVAWAGHLGDERQDKTMEARHRI